MSFTSDSRSLVLVAVGHSLRVSTRYCITSTLLDAMMVFQHAGIEASLDYVR